ncbi:hypothetical protein YYE_01811 [Plasmodium vinckei vinckei]|nr:hypothetical protein YYE_01811 [Plasmodium vinckei vinckei]
MILKKYKKVSLASQYMYIFSLINVLQTESIIVKQSNSHIHSLIPFSCSKHKKNHRLILNNISSNKKNYNAFINISLKKYKMSKKVSSSINMNTNNDNENIINDNILSFNKSNSDVKGYNRNYKNNSRYSLFSKHYNNSNNSGNNINNFMNNNIHINKNKSKVSNSYLSNNNSKYPNNNHNYSNNYNGYFNRDSKHTNNDSSHLLNEAKINTSTKFSNSNIKDNTNFNTNNDSTSHINDHNVIPKNVNTNSYNKENSLIKNPKEKIDYNNSNVSTNTGITTNSKFPVNSNYHDNSIKNGNYKNHSNEKRKENEPMNNNNNNYNSMKGNERYNYFHDNYQNNMKYNMKSAFNSGRKSLSTYNNNQYSKNIGHTNYLQKNFKREVSDDITSINTNDINKVEDLNMSSIDKTNNMLNTKDACNTNIVNNNSDDVNMSGNYNIENNNTNVNTQKINNIIKNKDIKRNDNFDKFQHESSQNTYGNSNNMRNSISNQSIHNRNINKISSYNYNDANNNTGNLMSVNMTHGQNENRMSMMTNHSNHGNSKILNENEKGANIIMNKHVRNISYDKKSNNYNNDVNKINNYDNFSNSTNMNNLGGINKLDNSLDVENINIHSSGNNSTSTLNLDSDASIYFDFSDFVNYMYKDENILTLFYIRKNYLKAESKEEFVNENDKIKCSIIWSFANNEKITVFGIHNTKKLSKKVCVKKILLKLKNISLLELDQMSKWMINSLNVILKVESKNVENTFNNNTYCTNIKWKVNNKIYQSIGTHAHEKVAEIIAIQKLYMTLYDNKDQLIKEAEYSKIPDDKKLGKMHSNNNKMYENAMFGKIMNNSNNKSYDESNMNKFGGNKFEYSKGQIPNKSFGDNQSVYNAGGNIQNLNNYDESYINNDNSNINNGITNNFPNSQSSDNQLMQTLTTNMYNRNMSSNIDMNSMPTNANNNNMNFQNWNNNSQNTNDNSSNHNNIGDDNINEINSEIQLPPGISDPSELIVYGLTKQDASSIQMLRNNIASRYKIHQTETFEQVYNIYKCTLEWEWKNGKISCKAKSSGYGSTKSLAKCEAAYDMLVKNNLIEYVSATDRKNAQYIRDLISKDLTKALNLGIQFIMQYSSNAWSIFVVYLLRELLIDGNYDHINRLLNTLVDVSKEGRIESEKINNLTNNANCGHSNSMNNNNISNNEMNFNPSGMNNNGAYANADMGKGVYENNSCEEQYIDSSSNLFFCNPYIKNQSDNSNYVHKLVSIDLWEKLIDECVIVLNDKLCFHCISLLREVELDYSIFISKCAHDYYKKYRIMLALELQANLAQSIQEKRDFEYLHENKSLLLKMKSVTMPILSFTCTLTNEEKEWMKSTQMREDDIVILKPYDMLLKDEDAWSNSLIGSITSTKSDNTVYNINVRIFSAENTKKGNIKYTKYKLYLLLNIVTHERMLQALRSITFISSVPTQYQSPYVFTPEIRFLILHTYNKHAKYIAQTGKMNEEIADDEKIKMNLQNNDPSKNSQEDILKDYSREAKNPYEDLLNEALNKQIGNTYLEDVDQYLVESINLPTNLPLNDSQKLACLSALTRRLTLVQGPPGTGKTHVACAIIDSWHRQNSNKKILAVADSNVAANNLVEGLKKRNIQAVRVGAGSDSDFHEEAIMEFHRYKDLLKLRKNNMQKEAKVMKALLFLEAVKKYNVVIATCVGSGHEIFDNEKFERVIIDECAQSIEPSNLIPLGHYCTNLVLIGDHKQLPPTIISPDAIKLGLDKSLLERFVMAKIAPIHLLSTQRRMHLSICTFPNFHFYDNKLKTANVTEENRPIIKGFLWPNPKCRLVFIDVSLGKPGSKFENAYGTSKFNLYEIEPLIAVLKSIVNEGCVSVDEIGILTAYDAQKIKLKKAVQEAFPYEAAHRIEIDSIDGFQGKEKDLILFSAVRSNANNELGFLRDARRLNVMLTRAKRGVIIFGDQFTLANDPANWLPWLKWISSKRAIVHITKLNEHLDSADYSLLDKLNKINKSVNLKNVNVSDNYYFYGDDTGFSNDYDPKYIQNTDNTINSDLNNNQIEEEKVEEIVENWEDLL